MTPDGISDEDWERVHELAVDIVNAPEGDDTEVLRAELFACLDELEKKYGELPSILATRGDYTTDSTTACALLERAFEISRVRADRLNTLYAASSLATLYVTQLRDPKNGGRWLAEMTEALKHAGSEGDIKEAGRLHDALLEFRGSTGEERP